MELALSLKSCNQFTFRRMVWFASGVCHFFRWRGGGKEVKGNVAIENL